MSNFAIKKDEAAIQAVNDTTPPETGRSASIDAKCWVFQAVVGGAGVTSLCIQTAFDLINNQEGSKPTVCLIDLDFENGTSANYLDLKPGMKISDLQGDPSRIDPSLIKTLTVTHKSGITLLAAPNSLQGNQEVNPDAVLALLDVASQMYDYIILDVPRMWQPWTHAAIAVADNFGLVTELSIPALHMTRSRIEMLEENVEMGASINVILNKYENRAFKSTLKITDAEQTIKRIIFAQISLDTDIVKEAINWGIPVGTVRSNSRYAKDCSALIVQWKKQDADSVVVQLKG